MATDKLNATLRSMLRGLADDPAHQPVLHQLNILLTSPEPLMPGANDLGRLLVDAGLLDDAQKLYGALAEHFPNQPAGPVGMADLAMRRKAWQEALTRWDEVIARFGDQPAVTRMGGRATALMELQRLDEAETIFRKLAEDFSQQPQGFVGLARLAMLRGSWSEALALWDEVFTRFSNQVKPYWHAGRATTLSQLDRLDEAEDIFRHLADDFPMQPSGFMGRAEIAARKSSWHEALVWWDEVIARFPRTANGHWQVARANVLVELGRIDEAEAALHGINESTPESVNARLVILTILRRLRDARSEFERILRETKDVALLATLFAHVAELHNGWQRTRIWIALLKKLDGLKGLSDSRSTALALRAKILLALRDYDRFLAAVDDSKECVYGDDWRGLAAVALRLRGRSFPDFDAPKIFGIGLSRTGTTSLSAALNTLSFHTIHWFNPLTHEMMSFDDLLLFDGFTDTPACMNFENYYFLFPNSKFIYTVRPFESWEKSMHQYFRGRLGVSDFQALKRVMADSDRLPFGKDFSRVHFSLYCNHKNYEEAYAAYDRRVRCFFQDKPKDRFLEFDVFAGRWDELCAFTGRAKPPGPFPWLNRKL